MPADPTAEDVARRTTRVLDLACAELLHLLHPKPLAEWTAEELRCWLDVHSAHRALVEAELAGRDAPPTPKE